jgi:dienelactone hydrolase
MISPIKTFVRFYKMSAPRMAFKAATKEELDAWQSSLRTKLYELSGLNKISAWKCEPDIKEEPAEDMGDYVRQKIFLQTTPEYWMPLYILKPKAKEPFIPVIALHGHGRGKADVAGVIKNEEDGQFIRSLNDYALGAVKRGYIVFAPDKRGFGERAGNFDCKDLAASAVLMGMSLIGLHTWDNQRLIDYITTRQDCHSGSLGCIGLSGGGGGTMWLAAIDKRISVAVISGHLSNYENGKFGCICNVAPNLLEWAERSDITGLIAPRPLLIESASRDECYSRERTLKAFNLVKKIYEVAGAPDRIDIDKFEGKHEWSGRKAWDWLDKWLKGKHETA